VIENIASILPEAAKSYFYRTAAGAEIDLVLDFGHEIWAVEIKKTTAPKLTKGFHIACDDLKPARKLVVYGGDEAFQLKEGVTAMPLIQLLDEIDTMKNR
jgi:predicted AAA+ superfamily ATPase